VWCLFFRRIYMWSSVSLVSRTALTVWCLFFRHIYVVVSFFGFWNSSNSVWFIFQTYIYMWVSVSLVSGTALTVWCFSDIYMWLSVSLVSGTALTVFGLFFRHIFIYVIVSFFGFWNSSNSVWFIFQTYICGCQFLWYLEQL
jgi:hypothetical protein